MLPENQIDQIVKAALLGSVSSVLSCFNITQIPSHIADAVDSLVKDIVGVIDNANQPLTFDEVE